ncbi:hypothetical protein TNCV_759191 [Trichonephila clavipes]|nr:hypothetical protein TNCV_759191 [Trichonephila clavipes]
MNVQLLSLSVIEEEALNHCGIMNHLIDYVDGQEEPNSLREDKIYAGIQLFNKLGKNLLKIDTNSERNRRRAKNNRCCQEFDIAHSVVSRLWKSFKTTGMCSRRHRGGRDRSTTPAEIRYIVLSAKRNRRTTAQQVANQFLAASGKQISRKTVARRLRGGGLYARRPVVCVPLTRQHRTARLQWCREHHN